MLYYALVFFVVALLAFLLGFFWLAGVAMLIAKVMFVIFLVMFLVSLLGGVSRRRLR